MPPMKEEVSIKTSEVEKDKCVIIIMKVFKGDENFYDLGVMN